MIKHLLAVLLLSTALCFAQDDSAPPLKEPEKPIIRFSNRDYVVEVPMSTGPDGMPVRMTKRLLFLFDCSGSMNVTDLKIAIDFVKSVMMQPLDEFEIGVLAFDGDTYRWPGIPEPTTTPPIPKGWASLPSNPAVKKVASWLLKCSNDGNTLLIPALNKALKEKRSDLSIIIVSDGGFHDSLGGILDAIKNGQKWRIKNKLKRVNIMTVGVDEHPNKNLVAIGANGKLGYFHPAPTSKDQDF
jgi:hypothetical protein